MAGETKRSGGVESPKRWDYYTLIRCPECGSALTELVAGAVRCLCRRCGVRYKVVLVKDGDYLPLHLREEMEAALRDAPEAPDEGEREQDGSEPA